MPSFAELRATVRAHRRDLSVAVMRARPGRHLEGIPVYLPRDGVPHARPLAALRFAARDRAPALDWGALRSAAAQSFSTQGPRLGYTELVRAAEPERTLWNGDMYRLLDVQRDGAAITLGFGQGSYFETFDCAQGLALEWAAGGTALRDAFGDPFAFGARSSGCGICALTLVRRESGPRFYLLRRSPRVAVAPNQVHVVPAGELQPLPGRPFFGPGFDPVSPLNNELLEELGGMPEDQPHVDALGPLLQTGAARAFTWGVVVDCLTLKAEVLCALVFDAFAFDATLGPLPEQVDEGGIIGGQEGLRFDRDTVRARIAAPDTVPLAQLTLALAWRDRDALLEQGAP